MKDCLAVDPEFTRHYYNAYGEADDEQKYRLIHFLQRHKLWDKFLAEDEQGKY